MNIMLRCATRLIAIGAVFAITPALASGSDAGFRLAMGPTSAAQKNQSSAMGGEGMPAEPHVVAKHHHSHHHMHHHYQHHMK